MKKNLVISMVVGLLLLLSLGAVLGGVKSIPAHAATHEDVPIKLTVLSSPAAPTGRIQRVACGTRTDFFKIWTDNEAHQICFANAGTINVKLYNGSRVSTGNNTGSILWRNDGWSANVEDLFQKKNTTYWVNNDKNKIVNQVRQITIN